MSLKPSSKTAYCVHGYQQTFWNANSSSFPYENCLSTTAFTKTLDYSDLSNKPTLFNGDYNSLKNLPVVVNGTNGLDGLDGADGKCQSYLCIVALVVALLALALGLLNLIYLMNRNKTVHTEQTSTQTSDQKSDAEKTTSKLRRRKRLTKTSQNDISIQTLEITEQTFEPSLDFVYQQD